LVSETKKTKQKYLFDEKLRYALSAYKLFLDFSVIIIIIISGCLHGELDIVYNTIKFIEQQHNTKIDLLLVCGDFQAVRNEADLKCMAMPPKYRAMQQFWKYYKVRNAIHAATIAQVILVEFRAYSAYSRAKRERR
jgi:hypothetical protein